MAEFAIELAIFGACDQDWSDAFEAATWSELAEAAYAEFYHEELDEATAAEWQEQLFAFCKEAFAALRPGEWVSKPIPHDRPWVLRVLRVS